MLSTLPDSQSRSQSRICCAIDYDLTTVFLFAQSSAQIMPAFRGFRGFCGNRAMHAPTPEAPEEQRFLLDAIVQAVAPKITPQRRDMYGRNQIFHASRRRSCSGRAIFQTVSMPALWIRGKWDTNGTSLKYFVETSDADLMAARRYEKFLGKKNETLLLNSVRESSLQSAENNDVTASQPVIGSVNSSVNREVAAETSKCTGMRSRHLP